MTTRSIIVGLGARQCLRSLNGALRREKTGTSSTSTSAGPASSSLLVWTHTQRLAPLPRNVSAACSTTDGGEGGDAKDKRQTPRQPKGFGTSSRNVANADPEGDVSNTEALLQTLGEVSQSSGRDPKQHLVLSDDTSAEGWKEIDDKVNKYPIERNFQAIGTGGNDFQLAMVAAVESVLGCAIPHSKVKSKSSSGGKYTSVNIGPCTVETSEQLTAIYQAMATDTRLKWWM